MKKTILSFLSVILVLTLCGCTSDIEIPKEQSTYSREYIFEYAKSEDFAKEKDDCVAAILHYIYTHPEFEQRYGTDFELTPEAFVGKSEINTLLIDLIWKGEGFYYVFINDAGWTFEISTPYFGRWEIANFYEGY